MTLHRANLQARPSANRTLRAMPLTPALSPSDGEREKPICAPAHSPDSALSQNVQKASLSPSDGERARVRGCWNCIVTDLCPAPAAYTRIDVQ